MLIFSEAETTIEYLHRELNPNGENPEIARLTGSNRHEAENIVKRFAPTWNKSSHESLPGPEIRVLLATDIVSEGQNLQDCARVVNYDLHWNPVRLIQRFGRVDRIGTEHEVIHLAQHLARHGGGRGSVPYRPVDPAHPDLPRPHRAGQQAAVGYRAPERQRHVPDLRGQGTCPSLMTRLDEVAANQRAIALLQRIEEDNPDLWRTITALPDGIRSALAVRGAQAEAADDSYAQNVLPIEGAQAPLMSPGTMNPGTSPFDDPRAGETLVLLSVGRSQQLLRRRSGPAASSHQSGAIRCRRRVCARNPCAALA